MGEFRGIKRQRLQDGGLCLFVLWFNNEKEYYVRIFLFPAVDWSA
jgi:hypothetical protein